MVKEAEPSKEEVVNEAEPSKKEVVNKNEPSKKGSKHDPNEVLLQWTDVEGKSWKLMASGKSCR